MGLKVVFILVLMAGLARADTEEDFLLVGQGAYSCYHYLYDLEQSKRHVQFDRVRDYHHWASGYISAVSMMTPRGEEMLRKHRNDDAYRYIRHYCRNNEDATFVNAVARYVIDLGGRL